jgi:hypothetical protein
MRIVILMVVLSCLAGWALAFTIPEDTIKSVNDNQAVCTSTIDDQLLLQLSVDKECYKPDEPVHIDFLVTNLSDTMIKLFFPTSQKYCIAVYSQGQELWNSQDGSFTLPLFSLYNMASGESLVYHAVWPKPGKNQPPPKPGSYEVRAVFSSTPTISPPPVSFRIEEK